MDVWLDLLPGLLLAAGIILLIKGVSGWYMFRRSIYKEIYSNYLEYVMRKKSLSRLSESYFLDSRLGKHRIYYQLAAAKGEKTPQAYVVLILTSGLYLMDIKKQTGEIEASAKGDFKYEIVVKQRDQNPKVEVKMMKNPMDEVRYFQKKLFQKLRGEEVPAFPVVVFPDASTLHWEEKWEGMPIIHRKEVYQTVKNLHEKHKKVLSEEDIDRIYLTLAGELLEAERKERPVFRKNEV